jgi:hypothetical protein
MRSLLPLLQAISAFQPTGEDWLDLEDLLQELWEQGEPQEALVPLFRLLERFPEDESAGVLMGMLHGIEFFAHYEEELLDSLERQPTDITATLVRRLANTGQQTIAGRPLAAVYTLMLQHPKAPITVKKQVQNWI